MALPSKTRRIPASSRSRVRRRRPRRPTAALSHITIADNTLRANGLNPTTPGWGIHLMSASDSTVADNRASGNGGGIYLTDEVGPNHNNRVLDNRVTNNNLQCGIILAGHVATLNVPSMTPNGTGGVYRNLVAHNVVIANGTTSQGGGATLPQPSPSTFDRLETDAAAARQAGDVPRASDLYSQALRLDLLARRLVVSRPAPLQRRRLRPGQRRLHPLPQSDARCRTRNGAARALRI